MSIWRKGVNSSLILELHLQSRLVATVAKNTKSPRQRNKHHHNNTQGTGASGLSKREKKVLTQRLLRSEKGISEEHVYCKLYPWEHQEALAHHLRTSQVYNSDGLIVLCKPYGIPLNKVDSSTAKAPQTVVQTLNSGAVPPNVPSLSQTLPYLKDWFGVDHLDIIKCTERWSSGIILLSTSSKLTEKVEKCLRRSKAMGQPSMKYWAVTVGLPRPTSIVTKVAITLEYVHNTGKVPVIVKEYSQTSANRGDVKPVLVKHRALSYSKETDASLLEINAQVFKRHFLRVWPAYCYSPVLGDSLYSGRVKTLAGRRIQVSPQNIGCEPQVLPGELYSKLALPPGSSQMIPCHLHLSRLTLNQFHKDKSDLTIFAPPPEHFVWTCSQLGLRLIEDEEEEEEEEEEGAGQQGHK